MSLLRFILIMFVWEREVSFSPSQSKVKFCSLKWARCGALRRAHEKCCMVLFYFCPVIAPKWWESNKIAESGRLHRIYGMALRLVAIIIKYHILFSFFGKTFFSIFLCEKQKDQTLTINNVITYQFDYKNGFVLYFDPNARRIATKTYESNLFSQFFLLWFLLLSCIKCTLDVNA